MRRNLLKYFMTRSSWVTTSYIIITWKLMIRDRSLPSCLHHYGHCMLHVAKSLWRKVIFCSLAYHNIHDFVTGHRCLYQKKFRKVPKKDVEVGFYTTQCKVALQRSSDLLTLRAEAMGGKVKLSFSCRTQLSSLDIPTTPNTPEHHKRLLEHNFLCRQPAYQDIAELLSSMS